MTYKTRQEVLRAASDWMDVCGKAADYVQSFGYGIEGDVFGKLAEAIRSHKE